MNKNVEKLNNKQVERLWEYRNHVSQDFFTRLSFFLVFESILIGVASQLHNATHVSPFVLKAFIVLGFLITVIWEYAQARSQYLLDFLGNLCKEYIPEYIMFRSRGKWPFSSTWLLTYSIPIIVALIWIIFLFL